MTNGWRRRLFFFGVLGLFAALLFPGATGRAQSAAPRILVTWSAKTYVPPFFSGKILPVAGSAITVSAAVVAGGRAIDLSGQEVRWYLDSDFIIGGVGKQTATIDIPWNARGRVDIRVDLPEYGDGGLLQTIAVPIAQPEAVIDAPFPGGQIDSVSRFLGWPFFFSVASPDRLVFSWDVGGGEVTGTENPDRLDLEITNPVSGDEVSITFGIQNPKRLLEANTQTSAFVVR